jgi:hypothetical protein
MVYDSPYTGYGSQGCFHTILDRTDIQGGQQWNGMLCLRENRGKGDNWELSMVLVHGPNPAYLRFSSHHRRPPGRPSSYAYPHHPSSSDPLLSPSTCCYLLPEPDLSHLMSKM